MKWAMEMNELHQHALKAARRFFQAEAELLDLIQKIDVCKGFRDFGHTSLFSYAIGELKLSESVALNLINVARKAVQVPALKTEIEQGGLSVCMARKIVPVLNIQNHAEWIEKAKTLPTRKLEKEIAKVAPAEAFPERVRYATEIRVNLSLSLDEKILEKIRRVQDLESQKKNRAVTLEETFAAMSAFYVEKNDPVEKAKRALANGKASTAIGKVTIPNDKVVNAQNKVVSLNGEITITKSAVVMPDEKIATAKNGAVMPNGTVTFSKDETVSPSDNRAGASTRSNHADVTWQIKRQPIPAAVAHEAMLRDQSQCTATKSDGTRCESRRWLHAHHIRPVSLGGANAADNLTTLCSAHHKILHAKLEAS